MSPFSFIAFQPFFSMTDSSSDSTHSVSCLSRGLAFLGLAPSSGKRAALSEKNLNLHNSDTGSETSSTESWFTVEKSERSERSEKAAAQDKQEKPPSYASDSASLVVETYEEDLPEYAEKNIAISLIYKHHEVFLIVKPTTRVKSLKVSSQCLQRADMAARLREPLREQGRAAP